jgi:hypothetical protein
MNNVFVFKENEGIFYQTRSTAQLPTSSLVYRSRRFNLTPHTSLLNRCHFLTFAAAPLNYRRNNFSLFFACFCDELCDLLYFVNSLPSHFTLPKHAMSALADVSNQQMAPRTEKLKSVRPPPPSPAANLPMDSPLDS